LLEIFKLLIGPVTGAALALFVNFLNDVHNNKPKILFSLDRYFDVDVGENYELSNTSNSGYKIVCYNIGKVPVFISSIDIYKLFHKKDFLIEIYPSLIKETKSLMPFSTLKYDISVRDLNGIINYCKTNNYNDLNIIAYGVDNKKYKGKINLWWAIAMSDD